ncbi:hypothetical protein ACFFNY_21785 [Paenibacillus hodogayensis]|uniref:Sigma-70 family RNA polymerase sigma factor n=1 Tax=Paenibacillus hodogayensis TaxID=279208 RepID=A0ABV5W0Y5_9BACL
MNKPTLEQIDYYRDEVCSRCPGSLWGAKSICRVHQCSIGEIEACPQWEAKDAGAAAARHDPYRPSAKTEDMELVEEELKDYPWMVREIDRLRDLLEHVGGSMTGLYGLDGAMPKGKGRYTDSVNREAQKREKHWSRLRQLEAKVTRLETAAERIADDRQRTVLECIMEGQRMNHIARHIGVSRQRLHELKIELVRFLAKEIFGDDRKGIS